MTEPQLDDEDEDVGPLPDPPDMEPLLEREPFTAPLVFRSPGAST